MKLGIGAAQFGLDYGVSNTEGITPIAEVVNILQQAESLGIELIDTAPAYGDSEAVLGSCICLSGRTGRVSFLPNVPAAYSLAHIFF
jgi:aryl-alcohol dehydrogenase-like predicted oxidoreductase